jgi:hypothetical protein
MANEIIVPYVTGLTIYVIVFNSTGQAWNTSTLAFENFTSADWTHYAIVLTEKATATGVYEGNFPAAPAGTYGVVPYNQAGGGPATTDGPPLGPGGVMNWSGTAELQFGFAIPNHVAGGSGGLIINGQATPIPATLSTPVTAIVNLDKNGYALAASGLDSVPIEIGINARQSLSELLSILCGVNTITGNNVSFFAGGNPSTLRASAVTNQFGVRSSVSLYPPS